MPGIMLTEVEKLSACLTAVKHHVVHQKSLRIYSTAIGAARCFVSIAGGEERGCMVTYIDRVRCWMQRPLEWRGLQRALAPRLPDDSVVAALDQGLDSVCRNEWIK